MIDKIDMGLFRISKGELPLFIIVSAVVIGLIVVSIIRRRKEKKNEMPPYEANVPYEPPPGYDPGSPIKEEETEEVEYLTVEQIKEDMEIGRHVAHFHDSQWVLDVEEVDRLVEAGFIPITLDTENSHYWFWKPGEKPADHQ